MSELEIAVINWNTRDYLKDCLNSFGGYPKTVIDNGSTDGSAEMVKKLFPEVKLIVNEENKGYSKAANQAIVQTNARYLLLLNSDTVLMDGKVEDLVELMGKDEQVGCVGPLLVNADGSVQLSGRNFPSFLDATMHSFFGVVFPNNRFSRRYKLADWDRQTLKQVDWVSGAAMLIDVKAAKEVGLFDENYFMYVEDMDFCLALRGAGFKVYLSPEAKVLHHWGEATKKQSVPMIIEFQKSIYRFFSKQNRNSAKRFLKPLVALGLFVRALLLIIKSRTSRTPKT